MSKIVLSLVVVLALGSLSFAAFSSVKVTTITAGVVLSAAPSGTMQISLKQISDYATTASSVTWSNVVSTTDWKVSDVVIIVTNTYNAAGAGIRIYTDNLASGASPIWDGVNKPTDTYNCAGLIKYNTDGSSATTRIPLSWRITSGATNTFDIREGSGGNLYENSLGSSYYCYQYIKDKATPNIPAENTTSFGSDPDGVAIWKEGYGMHHASGSNWASVSSPYYVYLGAKFTSIATQQEFKTSQLKIELYTE